MFLLLLCSVLDVFFLVTLHQLVACCPSLFSFTLQITICTFRIAVMRIPLGGAIIAREKRRAKSRSKEQSLSLARIVASLGSYCSYCTRRPALLNVLHHYRISVSSADAVIIMNNNNSKQLTHKFYVSRSFFFLPPENETIIIKYKNTQLFRFTRRSNSFYLVSGRF